MICEPNKTSQETRGIEPTLVQCLVFAGIIPIDIIKNSLYTAKCKGIFKGSLLSSHDRMVVLKSGRLLSFYCIWINGIEGPPGVHMIEVDMTAGVGGGGGQQGPS